ncbi:unnamed protein product, partial [Closterium sp. NIES-54]
GSREDRPRADEGRGALLCAVPDGQPVEGGPAGPQVPTSNRGFPSRVLCLQEEVEKIVPGLMKDAERYFVLSQTDNLWKEHLQALKFAQQAVGLRGYAQKDPLIEYKLEGYNLFLSMMAQIRRNVIYSVYQKDPLIEYKLEGYNLFLSMMAQICRNVTYSVYQPVMAKQPDLVNVANGGAAAAAAVPAVTEASQASESTGAAAAVEPVATEAAGAAEAAGVEEAETEGEGGVEAATNGGAGPTGGRGGQRRGGQKGRQRAGKKVTARSKST